MRVALLGANGFIGRHLSAALERRGDDVVAASLRDPHGAAQASDGCDAVVNLAGEPIGRRWSAHVKRQILESRSTAPARLLAELANVESKPGAYISASAIGYYGTSETATFTESSPPGRDFLAQVCVAWENAAAGATSLGMRVCCVRAGLVLGTDGGALPKILSLFKSGAGGRVGSGHQWYSWIHIEDAVGIYLLAIDAASGALNATSPNPERNADFTAQVARTLHRPAALAVPAFALNLALGEGAMLVLEGQRVLPERANAQGYQFAFPTLGGALDDLLH